jgi:hypothetical protein
MYVCMYVCVYVCMCMCACVRMYVCVMCVFVRACVCMYVCVMCVCMYVCVFMCVSMCVCARAPAFLNLTDALPVPSRQSSLSIYCCSNSLSAVASRVLSIDLSLVLFFLSFFCWHQLQHIFGQLLSGVFAICCLLIVLFVCNKKWNFVRDISLLISYFRISLSSKLFPIAF